MRYLEKVERRPDKIPNVRYPEKVERRSDRILDVRYPGGMSENFRPGGMSDAMCRKGPSTCPRKREPCGTFLGRIPQWVVVQAVLGGCITTKGKTARSVF